MTLQEAMLSYFNKLTDLYAREFGTLPTVPYNNTDSPLFVGQPDLEGEIQWQPSPAEKLTLAGLCPELSEFYSTYYYWHLSGKLEKNCFYFPPVFDEQEAIKTALFSMEIGRDISTEGNYAVIASCDIDGFDGIDLVYDQDSGKLYYYDFDKDKMFQCEYSLTEIISQMEAII